MKDIIKLEVLPIKTIDIQGVWNKHSNTCRDNKLLPDKYLKNVKFLRIMNNSKNQKTISSSMIDISIENLGRSNLQSKRVSSSGKHLHKQQKRQIDNTSIKDVVIILPKQEIQGKKNSLIIQQTTNVKANFFPQRKARKGKDSKWMKYPATFTTDVKCGHSQIQESDDQSSFTTSEIRKSTEKRQNFKIKHVLRAKTARVYVQRAKSQPKVKVRLFSQKPNHKNAICLEHSEISPWNIPFEKEHLNFKQYQL